MKTKQLLEIIFKSIAIFIIIPKVIYLPVDMYHSVYAAQYAILGEYTPNTTAIMFVAVFLVYLLFIYYLLIRTDIIVKWVYKEKEDEQPINLRWHSKDIIYIIIVISSLHSLFNLTPTYFVNLIKSLDLSNTKTSLYNSFSQSDEYFYQDTAQIVVSLLVLINARRITAWIEAYRKKQMKKDSIEQ